ARGGLRLDQPKSLFGGSESGPVVIAGKPADSILIQKVTSKDATERMPPQGEPLSTSEVDLLKAWVTAGAKIPSSEEKESWWAFKPLAKPAIPAGQQPIDFLIRKKLSAKGWNLSPPAAKTALLRRVTYDITGLPPTVEEIRRSLDDNSPEAYERVVDRLLNSSAYGERWARLWLDLVHYADTHGYDKDKLRPNAWPYRDHLIRALNNDMPFDRFVREQIAGDILYPGDPGAIEALGMLSAGPWDFIGHAEVPETKIDGKVARHLDRDDMVGTVVTTFLGLTVQCAQCHNHKFDPISQEEYYGLQAVFAAIDRADRPYFQDPTIAQKDADLRRQIDAVQATLKGIDARRDKDVEAKITVARNQWQSLQKSGRSPAPEYGWHSPIENKAETTHWVQVDLGASRAIASIVLEPCWDDFGNIGAGFGFPTRWKLEGSDGPDFKTPRLLFEQKSDFPNPGIVPVALPLTAQARYVRLTVTRLTARQNDFIAAVAEMRVEDASGNNFALHKPVTASGSIEGPPRWRASNLTDGIHHAGKPATPETLASLKARLESLELQLLTEADRVARQAAQTQLDRLIAERARMPKPSMVYCGTVYTGSGAFTGTGGKPRPISLLRRGNVTQPGKPVKPGALSLLNHAPAKFNLEPSAPEGERRASLAQWITHPDNPLFWRVMANRVWRWHMGRGLVETPSDFGKQGQPCTHPELLDHLALFLRDNRGSLKALHRHILTSATYRQGSDSIAERAATDADNSLFWRANRQKLDSEQLRDTMLLLAGKLDRTMYGPGFMDFVIEKPEHSPHYQYHLHDPEDSKSHRRTVYRFVVRSQQQPFLTCLDCADASMLVDRRNESITPQQALALLNNRFALVMAKHFGDRLSKSGASAGSIVGEAVLESLGRPATEEEVRLLSDLLTREGAPALARLLFNLNEFTYLD
ncbi:MAG: DUF1553 domain-containing protein, partial [Gemmataceae bacterium]